MGIIRKILIFLVLTTGIIMLGRLAPRFIHSRPSTNIFSNDSTGGSNSKSTSSHSSGSSSDANSHSDSLPDSTNALPEVVEDTTGGKWQQKLFSPLLLAYGLPDKHLKPRRGFFEITFPRGKPIHEYALDIENLCRQNDIVVEQGVELHPSGKSIEYLLQSNGQHIKLRATLGTSSMAGAGKLAIVLVDIDSLQEAELGALEAAKWEKTLVVDPYSPNENLKKLRFTSQNNQVLLVLPMEPSNYPYTDPGKHALFIHHSHEDVEKILSEGLDSLPKAVGYATKYGDRAIENLPLLDQVFGYVMRKNMLFLDLTGSQRSLSRQSAAAHGAHALTLKAFKDSLHVVDEFARRAAQAEKTGEGVFVFSYSKSGLAAVEKAISENTIRFNELGLELVTLSTLFEGRGDSAATNLSREEKGKLPLPSASKPVLKIPGKDLVKPTSKIVNNQSNKMISKKVVKKPLIKKISLKKPPVKKPIMNNPPVKKKTILHQDAKKL